MDRSRNPSGLWKMHIGSLFKDILYLLKETLILHTLAGKKSYYLPKVRTNCG